MNKDIERVKRYARAFLKLDPDPIPRFRILRDVLHRDPADPELVDAKANIHHSKWVKQLTDEQNPNGGWSRFHSMNSRARHKIPTTEFAVFRALTLGLTKDDAILTQAQSYLEGLLAGATPWPEDEEKEPNDRWPTGEEMFISSTLALIDPQNSLLQGALSKWCRIAEAAFAAGSYDPEAEWRAHCRLTGATTMRKSYLVLNNRYALTLLGLAQPGLKTETDRALVDWLWQYPQGIMYLLDSPLDKPLMQIHSRRWSGWFASHWIISHFKYWRVKIKSTVDTLWSLQTPDGFWDLGAKAGQYNMHLSESWRKPKNRLIDQSVRVLLLVNRYYGQEV